MATTTEPRTASVSVTVGDQELTFESGKLAKQADGAVVVRSGETMVLATAQGKMEAREGADFFPLTVDVEERMYAAGKIPGGFFKREGRPTERAILTARMLDRPIRPLWPKGFRNEVQVICTVLSADLVTPHDILCINGATAALQISPLPFMGPIGAVRIGLLDVDRLPHPRRAHGARHARTARAGGREPDRARALQRARHDPRDDDGLPRRRPDPRRVRELPRAAHDRRRGHGVPAPERRLLLVLRAGRRRPHAQLLRGRGRSGHRLDGLCAALHPGARQRP